jgi:hypothetical protein
MANRNLQVILVVARQDAVQQRAPSSLDIHNAARAANQQSADPSAKFLFKVVSEAFLQAAGRAAFHEGNQTGVVAFQRWLGTEH